MSGIRTGDWGALESESTVHCWVVKPRDHCGSPMVSLCCRYADLQRLYQIGENGEWGPVRVCEKCREIVERAAREVPA